jgi:glucose-1-phosphate cytidylyltransferase
MKVVILAGGYGTRLSEETDIRPKPMVEIGGKPIIWHIMKIYSHFGFNEFIVLLGYKGIYIKDYFHNYFLHQSDVTIDIKNNGMEVHSNLSEPWKITLVDTGIETQTGGRLLRARKYLKDETFLMTYGDGVGNINIPELIKFHVENESTVTLSAVLPEGRFGALNLADNLVTNFVEKPQGDGAYVSGGFFVCEPKIFEYIDGDQCVFERTPLERLAADGKLHAYRHTGFWKPMDTIRDKHQLEALWKTNKAAWKIWDE